MSNKKDDSEDSLSQDIIARTKAKDFLEKLGQSITDYLAFKEEMSKYVMWDRVKKN